MDGAMQKECANMSEPIKKPRKAPESYSPKKPEIAGMMKEAQHSQYEFPPISSFTGEDGIYEMPPARFIGVRHNHMPGTEGRNQLGDFIGSLLQSETWNNTIKNLPNIINAETADFTCEYMPETDSFSFIMGVFAPLGTPVPNGLDFREVAPTLVWISQKDVCGHTGKSKEIPNGYEINFDAPGYPWQAFLRADTYAVLPIKRKEQ